MQVFAVAGVEVETLVQEGRPIGRLFNDGWARHLLLGDVRPKDLARPNTIQAAEVYQAIEDALSQANMVLSEVARTWLFLDNILSWYGPFNTVRTEIFTQQHLFEKGVPASTGIGARNPAGAALVAGAWAVQPLDGPIQIREVSSPLQCTARSYGSCFSRAMELSVPGLERLLVSGTASIEPIGRSAHQGDVRRQIQLTMEVVDAILISRKLRWTDVTRATAYFKRKKDAPCFTEWCLKHRVSLPLIVTECDICRDELLFEIELDAIAAHGLGRGADWEL
jgi:enamine deaminase RidA (YjgF/YER057c/UK114 family)